MNYQKSSEIHSLIKESKNILINCHRRPDGDTIGSSLALYNVLKRMGKAAKIICPSEPDPSYSFLPNLGVIETVDFLSFPFDEYDLFIVMDSSNWALVSGTDSFSQPKIKSIVIDNHKTNNIEGDLRLVDLETSSVTEMLYKIFEDWDEDVDSNIAACLMTGLLTDTGSFQYEVYKDTFNVASNLIEKCDYRNLNLHLFDSYSAELLKGMGELLMRFNEDKEHKFVWVAMDSKEYQEYKNLDGLREFVASLFSKKFKDTDFGIVMVEEMPGVLRVSLRSRTDFDVSTIAQEIGGGGHPASSGAELKGEFKESVDKVVEVAKKYAKKA